MNGSIFRIARIATAAIVAAISLPTLVGAQEVRGQLREASEGTPIEGAFVVGVDAAGMGVAGSLTDSSGFFSLQLPDSGTFHLTAHRIGYQSSTSSALHVGLEQVVVYDMSVRTEAIVLSSLEVTAERRCSLVQETGVALDRIWAEARKAMTVAEWTRSSGVVQMQVVDYELTLDRETLAVIDSNRTDRGYYGDRPYQSLPAEELAEHGYVVERDDGTYYFAPDESVLLSDTFLQSHCFQATRDSERQGLIGLTFEPMSDTEVPDIEGAFWLDEETAELRFLEYRYSRLLRDIAAPEAGGRVEFRRLPGGAWIVSQWSIRMPEIATRIQSFGRGRGRDSHFVTGYREKGGEVVRTVSPAEVRAAQRAVVVGRVEEREGGVPLVGAVVFLSGTQYRTVTDSDGQFMLTDLPPGRFPLVYRHARLDELGTFARPVHLELEAGRSLQVTLYFPPAS